MKAKIGLISLPWHPYNFFSIQLGTLSATLRTNGFPVDVFCFFKDFIHYIPSHVYHLLHDASCGEALFSALLYPERRRAIVESLDSRFDDVDFDEMIDATERYIDDIMDLIDWSDYELLGFTTTHEQTTSSLYMSKLLKDKYPDLKIVFGGALFNVNMVEDFLKGFPFVDIAVFGEGERTLLEIASRIDISDDLNLKGVQGTAFQTENGPYVNGSRPLLNLDELPTPDFTDFVKYELVEGSGKVMPHIPFESTRGCFYGKCNFCNLDQQWDQASRQKKAEKVVNEVKEQIERYGSTQILFTDTNLSNSTEALSMLADLDVDLRIFGEVSGHGIKYRDMRIMRDAGVRLMQIGIESFSPDLLKSYEKGVSLIKNFEMLKWAKELGIGVGYNLIIRYPKDTQEIVNETISNIQYLQHFGPPTLVDYSFAYFSPAYYNLDEHNVASVDVPPFYKEIYPTEFLDSAAPLVAIFVKPEPKNGYNTDWTPLESAIEDWTERWNDAQPNNKLIWREGGSFLTIEEHSNGSDADNSYCIRGLHADIFRLCDKDSRSLTELSKLLDTPKQEIRQAIDDLQEIGIMFTDGVRGLSLALRDN